MFSLCVNLLYRVLLSDWSETADPFSPTAARVYINALALMRYGFHGNGALTAMCTLSIRGKFFLEGVSSVSSVTARGGSFSVTVKTGCEAHGACVCVFQDRAVCVRGSGGGERPRVIGHGGSCDLDQQY